MSVFEKINEELDILNDAFLDSFTGVPIRVDESLVGCQYYVAVSGKLFEEIKDHSTIIKMENKL